MTPEEFRRHGHQVVDWIADYRATVAKRPVASPMAPGEVARRLPASPPEQPESFDDVLRDLESVILPGLTHWTHPRFFGYFPSNSELSSVLGDYLSTGLGVLGLSWQASPALTELEDVTTDWARQMVGLSEAWRGVIQDTASTSTLVALLSARERAGGWSGERGGFQAEPRPLVVYTSDVSHSSVAKAARLAGFGDANVRFIAHDADGAMRAADLAEAIAADRRAGRQPCAVVATSGTTATTALDPIDSIAAITSGEDIWLHVDAAMAGSAMVVPTCRWMWKGIERADSLVFNPHKWLGAAFDCSLYYVRDPAHLVRVMRTSPSYLQSAADDDVRNLRDWGIPLGRRFRALKLWCLIRDQGLSGLRARIARDMDHARWLDAEIRATPDWEVLYPVVLQTVCVRHVPAGLDARALDDHTRDWVDRLNRSGAAYLTAAQVDGRWFGRVAIGAISTERPDVVATWTAMQRAARAAMEDRA